MLARPQPSTDYAGIFLALLAAVCWAGYVLVNRMVGVRLPGAQGPAAAASLSALLYVPIGIWALSSHAVTAAALGRAATAGILCSAVPMIADLQALRRVPARFFGVFMSVNPVFAALTGLARARPGAGGRRLARDRRHRRASTPSAQAGREQVQSGSVRGRPKAGSGPLSGKPVTTLIWSPARVSTSIPLACETGARGSRM